MSRLLSADAADRSARALSLAASASITAGLHNRAPVSARRSSPGPRRGSCPSPCRGQGAPRRPPRRQSSRFSVWPSSPGTHVHPVHWSSCAPRTVRARRTRAYRRDIRSSAWRASERAPLWCHKSPHDQDGSEGSARIYHQLYCTYVQYTSTILHRDRVPVGGGSFLRVQPPVVTSDLLCARYDSAVMAEKRCVHPCLVVREGYRARTMCRD